MKLHIFAGLLAILLSGVFVPYQAQASVIVPAYDTVAQAPLANDELSLAYHEETGKVRFLSVPADQAIERPRSVGAQATVSESARGFLGEYGSLFGLRSAQNDVRVSQERLVGQQHVVRFQQQYQQVPILGGELVVQLNGRKQLLSIHGEVLPDIQLDVTPKVSAERALDRAVTQVVKQYGAKAQQVWASEPALWIYNPALLGGPGVRSNNLVWRIELRGDGIDQPFRELVLVNAHTGIVDLHFNQLSNAKHRRVCDAKSIPDNDGDESNECISDAMAVRVEGDGPYGDSDVDLAYDYSGDTYDYFFDNFGRDSLDDQGFELVSVVKYCTNRCPFQNAFWNGEQMTYGAGFASADDVVAHELSHGFIEFTANLFYYYQSGAINESLADIFGEFVDLSNGAGDDSNAARWQIGEDLPQSIGVIRDMADPSRLGDPDRMNSPVYVKDFDGEDNGGVHTNSGVGNKTAYLITDGGTFNGHTILGLGQEKAQQIYYYVTTNLLTSASNYADLGSALGLACQTLIGEHGITAEDCQQVDAAVTATELLQQPKAAPTPQASICAGDLPINDIFFDDMEDTASGNWQSQALAGDNMWFYPSFPNAIDYPAYYATSGTEAIWGYADGGTAARPISPADYVIYNRNVINVPSGAYLHFRHSYDFEAYIISGTQQNFDGGVLEYSTNGGASWQDSSNLISENGYNGTINGLFEGENNNPLLRRNAFVGPSNGYISSRYDLSSLSGQQVQFRFRIGVDELIDDYGWFIDDFRVYTCDTSSLVNTIYAPLIQR
jgi:bacillolysin